MGNRISRAVLPLALALLLGISLIGSFTPVASAEALPSIGDNQLNSPLSSANSPALLAGVDDWTKQSPASKPLARKHHAMANIGGDQVLLFGGWNGAGYNDETWVYDLSANTWTEYNETGTKPSARASHAMANIGGDQVLLFGGDDGAPDDETWIYNLGDNTWTKQITSPKPSARYAHSMAKIGGDQVLLFGGDDGVSNDETWVYDLSDNTWTEYNETGTKPSARTLSTMANIGGDQVLLFGGWAFGSGFNDETWVYDLSENTWTEYNTGAVTKPSVRQRHKMAYIGGDQVLLFGGLDGLVGGGLNDETWVYDLSAGTWTLKSPISKPSKREYHAMADIGGGQVLLFGGNDGAYDNETWVYLTSYEIFADGFESGNLSAWDSKKTSGKDLKACAKAPITGTYSLCVKNKTNKTKFVKDDGFTESAYSFQFNLDPNGIKVKNKKKIRLVQAQGSKNTTWIEFRRKTGAYQIRAWAALDGGGKTKTGWKTISNAPHLIEVDWSASTAPGANDGFLRLYIDDALKQQLNSLNNDTYDVQKIKLGITKTVTNFTEKFYLDDFVSTNGGHIGP